MMDGRMSDFCDDRRKHVRAIKSVDSSLRPTELYYNAKEQAKHRQPNPLDFR